ncbi:MAG: B12-binding domain-containing radical SAM protein [Deltaproteobacteria bacterium RIFCSPLOWO2_02_FULL_53_8]|nr:MAG: B12-binding domain-containing radical SAM protein [Deltaproteobacteria bacterium RIFCSPLOWO2_02_FULL_53_8]
MKVLFLNPPFLKKFSRPQRSPAVTKSGTLYFPLWLATAAGLLMKEGFEVDFIDAPADGLTMNDVEIRAEGFKPEFIVLDTSTPSIKNDVAMAGRLKDLFPKAFVTLVGTHVSALADDVMKMDSRIDAISRNEYDYTILELARALSSKAPIKDIQGITWNNNGKIVHNERRPYIEDLDNLPFVSIVYKKFLKIENYFNPNALFPMVTITSSRGCPFPCTFCVYPQTLMGRGYRLRSVENVVSEMEYIIKNFPQAKAVFFEDDTMTVDKKRCKELSELIIKRGVKISWSANSRIGIDYETMRIMREAGCRSLCVGFESGSQKILDGMKKKTKTKDMMAFINDAKRAGIIIHGCFMAGLPGETKETLKETLDLAIALGPDTVQFYPVMVYPGTEAYDWYKQKNLIRSSDFSDWITPDGLHNTVIRTEELSSDELVKFCDDARRQFYLRPVYLIYKFKQLVTQPREIRRTVKAGRTFLKYLIKGSDVKKAGKH